MRTKRRIFQQSNTYGYPLRDHTDSHHPLLELADMMDWAIIDRCVFRQTRLLILAYRDRCA
jgi:IS5 family transposase